MDKIAISKIEIQIGKNKFELSLEDAMQLKKILNETFPDEVIRYIPTPYTPPLWIERPCKRWDDWHITYYNTTNGVSDNVNWTSDNKKVQSTYTLCISK